MTKLGLNVRATLNPHLSSFTVVEPFALRRGPLRERVEGAVTTWFTMLTAASTFQGFGRAQAVEALVENYRLLSRAAAARDLLELSKLTSLPLFELFEAHGRSRAELPFTLHETVEAARLVAARVFRRDADSTALSSWYQLYFRLWAVGGAGRAEQLVMVERREADFDLAGEAWRFAHLDDQRGGRPRPLKLN